MSVITNIVAKCSVCWLEMPGFSYRDEDNNTLCFKCLLESTAKKEGKEYAAPTDWFKPMSIEVKK